MGKVRILAMLTALALLLTLPAVAYAQSLPPTSSSGTPWWTGVTQWTAPWLRP